MKRGSALRLGAFARRNFLLSGFRFCGLAFAARIHWLKSSGFPPEIIHKILEQEVYLRNNPLRCHSVAYNPATLQGKRRLQGLWRKDARYAAIIKFGKV
jgi:hypothetical protein